MHCDPVLPGRNSGILLGVVPEGSRYNMILSVSSWQLEMVMGWEEAEEFTGGRKAWCSTQICLVCLEWGRVKDRPQQLVCFRAGHEMQGLTLEERMESEHLCLPASLTF